MTAAPITLTMEDGAYVVPQCPSWCVLPADHDLTLYLGKLVEAGPGVARGHVAERFKVPTGEGLGTVLVEQLEDVACGDPQIEKPGIVVYDVESLDAGQARELAHALTRAADRLDAILDGPGGKR